MKPRMEKIAKPATKLVPLFRKHSDRQSLQQTAEFIIEQWSKYNITQRKCNWKSDGVFNIISLQIIMAFFSFLMMIKEMCKN